MPFILEPIDYIALQKNRGVLFFDCNIKSKGKHFSPGNIDKKRQEEVMSWLDKEGIPHQIAGTVSWSNFIEGGPIHIYVDVPMDETNKDYKKLCSHFENEDGSMKFKNCDFYFLPLDICQRKSIGEDQYDDLV